MRLLQLPALSSDDSTRKARLLITMIRVFLAMVVVGVVNSLFDPSNRIEITVVFYGVVAGGILGLASLVQHGHVRLAGWLMSGFWWVVLSSVPVLFGGLQGENVSSYPVVVLLAGVTISGRAGIFFAIISAGWVAFIGWLESQGRLPKALLGYSVLNAFNAAATAIIMTSVLLRLALRSLEDAHQRERDAHRERDEAQRRSHDAQKMQLVGAIAAGVAHDFNNLLAVMSCAAATLRADLPEAERESVLDDLDGATARAALMTRHLLALGRPSRGPEEATVLDLRALAINSAALLPRLLGPTIELSVDAAEPAFVKASRAGLEQVVLNLAVNARDAMPRGGRLSLSVRVEERHVVLSVRDSGTGMDEATRKRIFEPFFTTKATGTGLGLSTVQRIVVECGGTIAVESSVGSGTTFVVTLPRAPDLAPSPPLQAPAGAPTKPREARRVLLIDDDMLVSRATTRLLERAGYDVVSVADGDEGLALLATSRFDIAVSDVSMRRVDGVAFAAEARSRRPAMPVLLLSGQSAPETLPGGVAFMPKPVLPHELLEAVARLIAAAPRSDA